MKPLVLTLRNKPSQRLDLSKLTPDRLLGKSAKEIEAIDLATTKVAAKVGDFFKVRAGDPHELRFEGGSERLDFVGAKLLAGYAIHIEGDVGMGLGRQARGGTIKINGDAGAYVASGMTAGRIEIDGDAGDFLAAPFAGELAGMAGGRVIVRGSVGARAGDRLRRGIVVIEGDAGDDLGSRAIAGTIVLIGEAVGTTGLPQQARLARPRAAPRFRAHLCRLRRASAGLRQALRKSAQRGQPPRRASAVTAAATLCRRHGGLWQGRDPDARVNRALARRLCRLRHQSRPASSRPCCRGARENRMIRRAPAPASTSARWFFAEGCGDE